ncbi:MAG: hypothetical protein R6X02_32310 [Enhygromyxa sp.]
MPSSTHQDLKLLFSNHPQVAFELARRARIPLGREFDRYEVTDAEFDDPLRPGNAVQADLAIVGHRGGKPHRGLVFEIQLGDDPRKEWSTDLYRAALRYRIRRPVGAVMFTPDPTVRELIRRRRFVHEPQLRPRLVTAKMVPDIRDLHAALADYPWAVLSATMRKQCGPGAVARALVAIQALLQLTPPHYERYIRLITSIVGRQVMDQVREQLPPQQRVVLSDLERRGSSFNLGLEEGREEGREEGLASLRTALLQVLEARGLEIDEAAHERIAACSELAQLRELIVRAAIVSSVDELLDR